MAQAKGRGGICLKGRCLLESDGTLDITAPANTSDVDPAESAAFSPFKNMTESEIEDLVEEFQNSNDSSSMSYASVSALGNNSVSLANGTSIDLGDASAPSNSSDSSPYDIVPVPELDSAGHILPDEGSSILNCPCNCTYVSAACCLSSIVWEDASQQIQMGPLPANATVRCDASTGGWVPNVSGTSTPTSSLAGFDDLGSARYVPPDVAAAYLPTATGN